MDNESFTRTITVDASPSEAYKAVTEEVGQWWGSTTAPFSAVDDEAAFSFNPNSSTWTFRATKLVPDRHVELTCTAANHIHDGLPDSFREEWLGTKLIFDIEPNGHGARIRLMHEGLTPALDCYEVCESGWDVFFVDSLKSYLDTGVGKPYQTE